MKRASPPCQTDSPRFYSTQQPPPILNHFLLFFFGMRTFATLFMLLLCFAAIAAADCGPGMHAEPTGEIICYPDFAGSWVCYNVYDCVPNEGCYDVTPGLCAPPIWLPQAVADRVKLPALFPPRKR